MVNTERQLHAVYDKGNVNYQLVISCYWLLFLKHAYIYYLCNLVNPNNLVKLVKRVKTVKQNMYIRNCTYLVSQ